MKIKDLSIYKDETYYIEAKAKKYTITINDIENSDGSKTNVELSAHFGERFDFSSLKDTGTNIAPNFTKYKGITSLVEADKKRDLTQIIDKSFANLLSQGYAVKAEYVNNAATITYKFPGLNLEDKKITVKKGSQAPSPLELVSQEELDSLVAPNTVIITGITPKLGLVTGDASYEVNSEIKSVPKHKISYVTNGGSEIAEQIVAEGSVITEPTQPKRTGYSFEGWYSDKNLQIPYIFDKMPSNDLTLYAKWSSLSFTVNFDGNEGSVNENEASKLVRYDEVYGELPTPIRENYRFNGWFTERAGGTVITSDTIVKLDKDQKLYAQWILKDIITKDMITISAEDSVFAEDKYPEISYSAEGIEDFKVMYKRQNIDTDWSDTAHGAGIYDVRLVRDECNDYQKFDAVFTSVFEISKSSRTISGWTPTVKDVYKVNLLATELPRDIYKGDGTVEYAISTSGSIPTEGWQESRSFMNLKSGSNYYVFVRVTERENYLAAPAIGSNVATAITGSITGNTKWEPRIQIKTFDGTDRAIHGTYGFYDGNWSSRTKLTGNGNDFEKGDDDYYTIKGWGNYDPWMISKYRLEFDHLVGQGWGCENLKPLVEYNDQRIRASQIDVNKKFNSDQNIIYDVTGFQRVIEEVGNFSSTGEDGILTNINLNNENLAEVYTFTYNGKVRDQYALPVVIIDGENSYIEYAYDAYDHYDAPSMYIEADKDKYNQYLDYTINSISINLANLKEVMENDGVTSTNIEVTLKFPERSATNETSKWTKIITVSFE